MRNPSQTRMRAERIAVSFGDQQVLNDVSLGVFPEETLVILGDSGCGKTTLLKVLAGLERPNKGEVWVNEKRLGDMPRKERRVVYLDQQATLFEHLNVFENVAFGLRLRRVSRDSVKEQVIDMLGAVGLSEHVYKRSWQLSGGQKQRIAFARAVLARPQVMLLDEPFGSLDSRTRMDMQQLYRRLAVQFRFTALFVTHDIREALSVGDRFAFMSDGLLKTFDDRASFISDELTGVQAEIQFWNQVNDA